MPEPAAEHIRDPKHARRRLEVLVERLSDPKRHTTHVEGSTLTLAMQDWTHYLRAHLGADAAHLAMCDDLAVTALLERLGASGRGWSGRAATVRDAIGKARTPALRVVQPGEPPDDRPSIARESKVWGLLAKNRDQSRALPTLSNVAHILASDSRWQDRILMDELSRAPVVDERGLDEGTPIDIAVWLARTYGLDVKPGTVRDAVHYVASQAPYHPVRDYLRGLAWDGVPRLQTMHREYLDARATDNAHDRIMSAMVARWMVAAVARVMRPGCHVKGVLLLIGAQEAGKSPFFRVLGGGWSASTKLDVTNKDAMQQVGGVWIYELAEVGYLLRHRDSGAIKSFIDQVDDRFRKSHRQDVERYDRQLVMGATDNDEHILTDPTGNARWWPVMVGNIRLDRLAEDRDQLWAEAVKRFDDGERWHLTDEERLLHSVLTERHAVEEPWQDVLGDWLAQPDAPNEVTVPDLLAVLERAGRYAGMPPTVAVGRWLGRSGWTSSIAPRARRAAGVRTVWTRPR